MDLEAQYKKESGYDVGKIHDIGVVYYSDDYVKWLENKFEIKKLEYQLFMFKVTCEIGFSNAVKLAKECNDALK